MYDPALLMFVAGILTGIAVCVLTLSAQHVLAALRHIRRQLRRTG
jgi:hypothetical protein